MEYHFIGRDRIVQERLNVRANLIGITFVAELESSVGGDRIFIAAEYFCDR